jgi:hypothetical protein
MWCQIIILEIVLEGFNWRQMKFISIKLRMKKSVLLNGITLLCAIKLQKFAKSICQGDKIYIEGRIKSRQWQTEDGATKH